MKTAYLNLALISLLLFNCQGLSAKTYLSQDEFVYHVTEQLNRNQTNQPVVFNKKALWLKSDLQKQIKILLGHPYPKIRITYRWSKIDTRLVSIWFLDEIGKERPISFAIWVQDNKVQQMRVLAFRESRGGEIAMPAFEQQFDANFLNQDGFFDNQIDGITGATLSVRAMKKMAKLAIMLHQWQAKKEKIIE
ncbi:MAG: FMN-binding protein [Enterobacterales bacterium]|nr:FMN-binding protein [Enterobacterales bacterium]